MPNGWFRPGDPVLSTGIYTAKHYQHRLPHEVFATKGEKFPPCRQCGTHVTFSLVKTANFISDDHDFGQGGKGPAK